MAGGLIMAIESHHYSFNGRLADYVGGIDGAGSVSAWGMTALHDGRHAALLTPGDELSFSVGVEASGFTLSLWMMPKAAGCSVIRGGDSHRLTIDESSRLALQVGDDVAASDESLAIGNHHHIAVKYDDGISKVFLDGVVIIEHEGAFLPGAGVVYLAGSGYEGEVIDFRVFNYALPDDNVQQLSVSVDFGELAASGSVEGLSHHYPDFPLSGPVSDEKGDASGNIHGNLSPISRNSGNAVEFTGAQYIGFPALVPAKSDFTITAFVNVPAGISGNANDTDDVILHQYGSDGVGLVLYSMTSHGGASSQSRLWASDFGEILVGPDLRGVGWANIAIVREGNNFKLYLNGELYTDSSADVSIGTYGLYIGQYTNSRERYLRAGFDDLAIYNRALSTDELQGIYSTGGAVFSSPFPYRIHGSVRGDAPPVQGWNPSPLPVPNPRAIGVSGRSAVIGVPHQRRYPVHFDQIDGSGGNGTPTGGVSDPARMGVIAGTVLDIQAQPVSRRVRVHERATGRIVRETWSDADGKYRFTDLDPRRAFYVMAFDHTLQQNAVVSDNVHSEVEDSP